METKILIYSGNDNVYGDRFVDCVTSHVSDEIIEFSRDMTSFRRLLMQPVIDDIIVVFCATSRRDVRKISILKDLLFNKKLILVLPDHERSTIHEGYKLYPRFIGYKDSDFSDVAAVLKKMVKGTPLSKEETHENTER